MTNEQKTAVDSAVEENGWVAVFSFTKGAEHVIDNPSDFGLVEKRLVDAGIQLRIETVKACEETHLKNEKYKEASERIADPIAYMESELKEGESLNGAYAIRIASDGRYLSEIAKEALKKQ